MMQWVGPINSGEASGADGSATANNSSLPLRGKVHAVYVKYNDVPPATTDVTVATGGVSPRVPAMTLLTLANANSDVLKYPRAQVHGTDGTALTMDGTRILTDKIGIDDTVKVTIAQANANDNVDVWLCLESV